MNFTDKQLEWLRWLAVVVLVAVFGFLGLQTPTVPPTPQAQTFGAGAVLWKADNATLEGLSGATLKMDSGSTMSVAGNANFTGLVTMTVVSVSGVLGNVTPVATATPIAGGYTFTGNVQGIPTLTIGGIVADTGSYTTSVRVAGTPVVAYATPAASGGLYRSCGQTVITGTGVIAHGLATPSYINAGLAQDATGDSARVSWTNSSATVTLKVWNSALTPAPNATGAAVDWCVFGTK